MVFRIFLVGFLVSTVKSVAFAPNGVDCWLPYSSQFVRLSTESEHSSFLMDRDSSRCWVMLHLIAPKRVTGVHATSSNGFYDQDAAFVHAVPVFHQESNKRGSSGARRVLEEYTAVVV